MRAEQDFGRAVVPICRTFQKKKEKKLLVKKSTAIILGWIAWNNETEGQTSPRRGSQYYFSISQIESKVMKNGQKEKESLWLQALKVCINNNDDDVDDDNQRKEENT
ncbi:hypothetical protein RUM43_002958 [Polyplax serrata]|uniref:Uncharacterized protein n=1 Tax=Polyplax serrata TaxID=468196 RepID=A0AAN8PGT1_POLSC